MNKRVILASKTRLRLAMLAASAVVLSSCLAPLIAGSSGSFTKGNERAPFTPDLKAGDYVWHPEVSPSGPVVVVVSLPQQTLFVYRNGIRIGRSTISSGKNGHRTPTGVFTILQKNVEHTSSIYKGASMPYMQRLTWDGNRHARRQPAGLSRIARLRAAADRFRGEAL